MSVTKKTCLGPTYGGAINKFLVINEDDAGDKYLAYSTAKKVFVKQNYILMLLDRGYN